MYTQNRMMVPPPPAQSSRIPDLLDQVRQEIDANASRNADYESQIAAQIHELEIIRAKVFQMEQAQHQIKTKYEEEIARMRYELEQRADAAPPHPPTTAASVSHPPHPAPPTIGHGPGNLFGGFMTTAGSHGAHGLAHPQPDAAPQQQPGPPPPHIQQPSQPMTAAPGPLGGVPPFYSSGPNPTAYPPPPQGTVSPGSRSSRTARGLPGPATPQQSQPGYPASPQVPRPTPPPQHSQLPRAIHPPPASNVLADLDPDSLPREFKKDGPDWYAVFNPRLRRNLDVDLVHTLVHTSVVCCVRFSLDGRYVATGCNRVAHIYDVESGQLFAQLQDMSLPDDGDLYIRSVCFSPDGRYLATGAEDKVIRVWDIHSGSIKHEFRGHEQDIYSLDYARNGRMIASGSGDRTVRLWDVERGEQVLMLTIDDGVTTVAISPDNRNVAAGSLDKSVRVWDTVTGMLRERLEGEHGHKDSVYSVAFSPSGRELVSGSLDKTIKTWELAPVHMMGSTPGRGKCIRTFEGHKDFVLSVALTPDGSLVMSGSKDRGVQFWDPASGATLMMLQGHKNSIISVAPAPGGKIFATGSGDMRARIWRYAYNPTM